MLFVSGGLSVDTFFVVGSALLVYGFFRSKHSKVKFNIPMFYLHRYIRLVNSNKRTINLYPVQFKTD